MAHWQASQLLKLDDLLLLRDYPELHHVYVGEYIEFYVKEG
jgi:hypothetical protein